MLREKTVDVALTPVIEFQRLENTFIVPGVCVGAKEKVRSVILVTRGEELKTAQTVALDTSSLTSVALTQIIFREFFCAQPKFTAHVPDIEKMLSEHDAALLIGDPALRVDPARFRVFDVVELWRKFTDCGFVFAFWLANEKAKNEARQIDFGEARDEGIADIKEIMRFYAPNVGLSPNDFYRYLTEHITYTLDADLLEGLTLYYRLAHKNRLIDNLKLLQFV